MVVLPRRALSFFPRSFIAVCILAFFCCTNALQPVAGANLHLYEVFFGGRYGFDDAQGNVVIKPQFQRVRPFQDGLAAIEQNGRWGYVDLNGHVVIAPNYDTADDFSGGLAAVSKNGQYYFIDVTGKVAIAGPFDKAKKFSNGLAPVYLNGVWQYIAPSGAVVISGPFSLAEPFSDSVAAVRPETQGNSAKWSYVNTSGSHVVAGSFDYAGAFADGAAPVKTSGGTYINFIDSSGTSSFAGNFTAALSFSEGLAPVEGGARWGYIDATGRMAIPEQYLEAGPFVGGRAKVIDGVYARSYYIDRQGTKVFPASDAIEENLGGYRTVQVVITVTSDPTERVRIFWVPLVDSDEHPGLLSDLAVLQRDYTIPESDTTPVTTHVTEQTYTLVYEDNGKLEQKRVHVIGPDTNKVGFSL